MSSWNGGIPIRNSKIKVPKLHQSTTLPYDSIESNSGAIYSGDPTIVSVNYDSLSYFAIPKSVIARLPKLSNNMFSGFKSL